MISKQVVSTDTAPQAIGPYSQAIKAGDYLFLSGQLPIDPELARLCDDGDIERYDREIVNKLGESLIQLIKTETK